MNRALRSKKLRQALFEAAGGRCQLCGVELLAGWHADHIEPWSVTGRTEVSEMQALCRSCNLRKGKNMFKPRRLQLQLQELCQAIAKGTLPNKTVVVEGSPGSGKGTLPVILTATLFPKVADKIIVVVPRDALREQAEEKFNERALQQYLGATHSIYGLSTIRQDIDLSHGTNGFVTTYDAIRHADQNTLRSFMRRYRCAVVLDECHHVARGSANEEALAVAVEHAAFRLLGSGTLERGDKKQISYLPYLPSVGRETLVDAGSGDHHWISYSLDQALAEQAVIRTEFHHLQGKAEWIDHAGERCSVDRLGTDKSGVFAALQTEFGVQLLRACLDSFEGRRKKSPSAKMLVVCASISQANKYLELLRSWGVPHCDKAVSKEDGSDTAGGNAKAAIKSFKDANGIRVLVTVAMAYEGLDVPAITHIACLTHIRSAPWILQMILRAGRFDPCAGPYAGQLAEVFLPDDDLMLAVLEAFKAAMNRALLSRPGPGPSDPPGPPPPTRNNIIPISSAHDETRMSDWFGENEMDADETAWVMAYREKWGLLHMSPLEVKKMLADAEADRRTPRPSKPDSAESTTPRERMDALRVAIQNHCNAYAKQQGLDYKELNVRVIRRFDKKRGVMNEAELKEVWSWVQREFPIRSAG